MRQRFWIAVMGLLAFFGCQESSSTGDVPPVEELPETLVEPPVMYSKNGILTGTLTAEPAEITVAGKTFTSNVYNGGYLAPVLRVKQGDSIQLRLVNNIGKAYLVDEPQSTNVHYHGMGVTPQLPGDNIYLCVTSKDSIYSNIPEEMRPKPEDMCGYPVIPGEFQYNFYVPKDHPQGGHWYHPHSHGFTEDQTMGGLSGMLIVDGLIEDHYQKLTGLRERVMILKDIRLPGAPDSLPLTKTINGMVNPTIAMRPGEYQFWRIGHIGANAFYKLYLDNHKFWILAQDGNVLEKPKLTDTLFVPPSARFDVVIQAFENSGSFALRSLAVDTGPQGDPNPEVVVATVNVGGTPLPKQDTDDITQRLQQKADHIESIQPTADAVEKMPITRSRTITYTETPDGKTFFIDGKTFDPNRVDITVKLGDVEKWTIVNATGELHTFHIHQLDFLVTKIKGQTKDAEGLRDVIDVPYQQNGTPGEVEMIVPFTNPVIVGKFVYHCHIMEHEDHGMMANIEVVK